MTGKLRPLAALALVGVISAGCGSKAPSAHAGSTASPTSTAATKKLSRQEKLVKLAECLRAHGVSDFPDPNAKGEFPDYGVSVSGAVWNKANVACKDLTPPGTFSANRNPKQQSAALRFAACVRANGVKDFPDPVDGEPLIDTYKIPSSNRPGGMTVLNAAVQKCGKVVRQAAGGQG